MRVLQRCQARYPRFGGVPMVRARSPELVYEPVLLHVFCCSAMSLRLVRTHAPNFVSITITIIANAIHRPRRMCGVGFRRTPLYLNTSHLLLPPTHHHARRYKNN
jgi:hypothetical protein